MGEGIFERNLLLTDFQSTLGKVEEVADFMELASGDSMVATFDQICQRLNNGFSQERQFLSDTKIKCGYQPSDLFLFLHEAISISVMIFIFVSEG